LAQNPKVLSITVAVVFCKEGRFFPQISVFWCELFVFSDLPRRLD